MVRSNRIGFRMDLIMSALSTKQEKRLAIAGNHQFLGGWDIGRDQHEQNTYLVGTTDTRLLVS